MNGKQLAPSQNTRTSDAATLGAQSRRPTPHASSYQLLSLLQMTGNQVAMRLFESGAIQPKLRVSQPGDADEIEADRVANEIVNQARYPKIHRKCACDGAGSPCPRCESEANQQGTAIHRSVASNPSHSALWIQRFADDNGSPPASQPSSETPGGPGHTLSQTVEGADQSSDGGGTAALQAPSAQPGTSSACTSKVTDCTSSDDPSKIVCEHKIDPDTIQKPGDTVKITAKFACKVRSWASILETSDGKTSLNLREEKTEKANEFSRSWNGKKQFGKGTVTLGTYLAEDGEYRHRFDKLLFAYKATRKKATNLFATGPGLISSNTIKVKLRTFMGVDGKPEHFHSTPDNVAMLGDVIYSEVGIGNKDEKVAVAWAVRNQMIRIGTAKVVDAVNHFHDSIKQHTKVNPKDTPEDVARKNESAQIAEGVLKQPMSGDPTGGGMRWFSPDSMPKEGQSCRGFDCGGGLITVKDLSGKDRRVFSPEWRKAQTKASLPGVRDWRLMLYKL